MRRPLAFGALAALCAGLVPPAPASTPPIAWRGDLNAARAEAREQGRLVWVQFTGPWCHVCRVMERETFARPEVAETAARDFVAVQVRPDGHEELVAQYGVTTLPTTVILLPTGEVLARRSGYADPATFRAFLEGSAASRPRPAAEPRPALGGICLVTLLRRGELVAGAPAFAADLGGLRYHFADDPSRRAFLKEPARFLPADGGRCVVARVERGDQVVGDARWGVHYRGRLYFCADEPARKRFAGDPERFANADVADRGFCPHCRHTAGPPVRGEPRFSAEHDGRRYFFPAPDHLNAFRADPERYLR